MNEKIKLIWDFRGNHVESIAKHHKIHLDEYLVSIAYEIRITGTEIFDEFYSVAYMIIKKEDMIQFRDALRPHRAEVYEENL